MPANVGESRSGQIRGKSGIAKALKASGIPKAISAVRPKSVMNEVWDQLVGNSPDFDEHIFKIDGPEALPEHLRVLDDWLTANTFCPTGEGGGVDPSCSSHQVKLTDSETRAVKSWTQSAPTIRRAFAEPLKVFESTRKEAEAFSRVLDKVPAYEGEIHRGVKLKEEEFVEFMDRAVVDKEMSFSIPLSASKDEKTARQFTSGGRYKILITFDQKSGADISRVSTKEQQEVVVKPGTKFKVIKVSRRRSESGEFVRLHLKEITNHPIANAFCPTGEGGGVDPSCSPAASDGWSREPNGEVVYRKSGKIVSVLPVGSEMPKAKAIKAGSAEGGKAREAIEKLNKLPTSGGMLTVHPLASNPDEVHEHWSGYDLEIPAKGSGHVMEVPIDKVDAEETQLHPGKIKEYIRHPPSEQGTALSGGGRYYLLDGNHRLLAAHLRGDKTVKLRVSPAAEETLNATSLRKESWVGTVRRPLRGPPIQELHDKLFGPNKLPDGQERDRLSKQYEAMVNESHQQSQRADPLPPKHVPAVLEDQKWKPAT